VLSREVKETISSEGGVFSFTVLTTASCLLSLSSGLKTGAIPKEKDARVGMILKDGRPWQFSEGAPQKRGKIREK